jgi:hypothetical protein
MRGRVGFELSKELEAIGFEVRSVNHNSDYSKYLLPSFSELSNYSDVVVIHSGQPNAPRKRAERVRYLSASRDLIEESRVNSLGFVFVSSLTAHQANRSNYSRDKQYLEELTIANSGLVVKLGIVSGLKNSYDLKIAKLQTVLSFLRLSFLLNSSTIYFTNVNSLKRVALDLVRLHFQKGYRVYIDAEFHPVAKLSVFESSLRRLIANTLSLLSKAGSGKADVLVGLMDGMSAPK